MRTAKHINVSRKEYCDISIDSINPFSILEKSTVTRSNDLMFVEALEVYMFYFAAQLVSSE